MTTAKTYNVEVIGPNLNTMGETFHVHKVGCSDIRRDPKHYGYSQYRGYEMRLEVKTLAEVSDTMYPPDDFQTEPGANVEDFKVFPCVGDLPTN